MGNNVVSTTLFPNKYSLSRFKVKLNWHFQSNNTPSSTASSITWLLYKFGVMTKYPRNNPLNYKPQNSSQNCISVLYIPLRRLSQVSNLEKPLNTTRFKRLCAFRVESPRDDRQNGLHTCVHRQDWVFKCTTDYNRVS